MIKINSVISYLASLYNTNIDGENDLTNLKLQKLLYYCQGFHLYIAGKPLFSNTIQAWEHGPVVPDIYRQYNKNGANPIAYDELIGADIDGIKNNQEISSILDQVYCIYGGISAWKLRNMTHEEDPWKNTSKNQEISHEKLKEFFVKKIS